MYEQRIDHLESQVDAYDMMSKDEGSSLEAQFRELASSEAIEQEMAELKKKRVA